MLADDWSIAKCVSVLYRYGQVYVGKKLEKSGIGSGQYSILLTLYRKNGVSQEELADALKTDKGCIAKSIQKLERGAYVERFADAEDKRANKVFLTKKALDVIPEVQRAIGSWEEFVTGGLPDGEKQEAVRLLRRMAGKTFTIKAIGGENAI